MSLYWNSHIDMFMSGAIIFQLVTVYGILQDLSLPFGLKIIEELIPYLSLQSFSKSMFEAYGRTWYMSIIPAGYDAQFFTLYQNVVGIGHSWVGSLWVDFIFQENGSAFVMNIILFLFVM